MVKSVRLERTLTGPQPAVLPLTLTLDGTGDRIPTRIDPLKRRWLYTLSYTSMDAEEGI